MANQTIQNFKSLAQNPKARIGIIATFGVIVAALVVTNMNTDSKNQRPADLNATVNIGNAPRVQVTPGTSDNVRHNELVQKQNEQNAQKALETGNSSVPRLVNPGLKEVEDPFKLVGPANEPRKEDARAGEITIPLPPTDIQPVAKPEPQPISAPQAPVVTPEMAEKKAAQEESLKMHIASMLNNWAPVGQRLEFNYTGTRTEAVANGSTVQTAGGVNGQTVGSNGVAVDQSTSAGPNKNVASIKAGSIVSAIILTSVNSDEPGPVLAQIVSGPYAGARVMGSFSRGQNAEKLTLQFNTISIPNAPTSFGISAYAVDPDSARTALASNVDKHYLERYGSLFASSFLTGYAGAIAQSGATQTTTIGPDGVNTSTQYPTLNSKEKALIALGEFGSAVGEAVGEGFNRPVTITLNSGVSIGLLFMSDATFK